MVDMGSTSHNAPTHGESGHGTMGAVGAASHYDLSTWVEGSGTSVRPWGRGGVTGAALGALLISILAWIAPPTQHLQFACIPVVFIGSSKEIHHLQIELPANKHTVWTAAIHSLLTADRATHQKSAQFQVSPARHYIHLYLCINFTIF